jgi:hypothetical protein
MRVILCVPVVSIWLLSSCSGTKVALNERLFEVPSMDSAGAGCTLYASRRRQYLQDEHQRARIGSCSAI